MWCRLSCKLQHTNTPESTVKTSPFRQVVSVSLRFHLVAGTLIAPVLLSRLKVHGRSKCIAWMTFALFYDVLWLHGVHHVPVTKSTQLGRSATGRPRMERHWVFFSLIVKGELCKVSTHNFPEICAKRSFNTNLKHMHAVNSSHEHHATLPTLPFWRIE